MFLTQLDELHNVINIKNISIFIQKKVQYFLPHRKLESFSIQFCHHSVEKNTKTVYKSCSTSLTSSEDFLHEIKAKKRYITE